VTRYSVLLALHVEDAVGDRLETDTFSLAVPVVDGSEEPSPGRFRR
jgi:hypothetical protein